MKGEFALIIACILLIISTLGQSISARPPDNTIVIKVSIAHDIQKNITSSYILRMYTAALNYSWIVDGQRYKFEPIGTDLTLFTNANSKNRSTFDVHIESGVQQISDCSVAYNYANSLRYYINGKWFSENRTVLDKNLENFIKDGHGYIGNCYGASYALSMINKPKTEIEYVSNKTAFLTNIKDDIKEIYYAGYPIFSERHRLKLIHVKNAGVDDPIPKLTKDLILTPKKVGHYGYFCYMPQYNNSINDQYYLLGFPTDLVILNPDHPIFKDYLNNTLRVRFGGGMSFNVSSMATDISLLARFPNDATNHAPFIAWHFPYYMDRFSDHDLQSNNSVILSRIKAAYFSQYVIDGDSQRVQAAIEKIPCDPTDCGGHLNLLEKLGQWFYNLSGWMQNVRGCHVQYCDPHINGNTSLVAFNYTNGRVVLCSCHPEFSDWDPFNESYQVIPANDSGLKWQNLTIYNGLDFWEKNIGNNSYPNYVLMNLSDTRQLGNAWFIQRETAWASKKVQNDSYLPPAYGRSQVVDISHCLEKNPISLKCCVGKYNNENWIGENLSLFYRYNGVNSSYSWTSWKRYSSIHSMPYCFTFNASRAKGPGHYEFCSLMNVTDGSKWVNETFPPGADADCYIGTNITADYTTTPVYPYVNQITNFSSTSVTKEETSIVLYTWSFGDGLVRFGPNLNQITHTYDHPGIYKVNLTVKNNLSQENTTRRNLTVIDRPPVASFIFSPHIAPVNYVIHFYDQSTDLDGTITNRTWDFGDGGISHLQNPTHAYNTSNYTTITLTVTDNDGNTDTYTDDILIYNALANASLAADNSSAHSWKTLQKAIDNTSTNGIIYVASGTYRENISIPKSITIIGNDSSNTIIYGKVTMTAPHDYELPANDTGEWLLMMNNTDLLLHLNNDSAHGENYASSSTIHDYSDYNRTVTAHGATWKRTPVKGAGSFSFDGTDDSINLTTLPALTQTNISISAWINWTGGGTGNKPILTQLKTPTQGYSLTVNDTTDKPTFQLNTTTITSPTTLTTGWHNFVGTHNATTLALYIDGTLAATQTIAGRGVNAKDFIGYDNASHYYNGDIDEIAVWNRTLTAYEIQDFYKENIGATLQGFTIENSSSYALSLCNNTEIDCCIIKNASIGIKIDGLSAVRVYACNIINCTTGIRVNTSVPDQFNRLRFVACNLNHVIHGINITNSKNVTVITTCINGSHDNLTFTGGNYKTLYVTNSFSPKNVKPSTPILTGTTLGDPGKTYQYSARSNDPNNDQLLYDFDWGDGNTTGWQNFTQANTTVKASHSWAHEGGYYVKAKAKDIFQNESDWAILLFRTENLPPIIHTVSNSPGTVGFGGTINITANVTDNTTSNSSGVKSVTVNITYPDHTHSNTTMTETANNIYTLAFTTTWQHGRYNYTVYAQDNAYNNATSTQHHFYVNATASLTASTLKDTYISHEYINLTDPPNPPENTTVTGRGLTWTTFYDPTMDHNILQAYQIPINYQDTNGTWQSINQTLTTIQPQDPAYTYGYRTGNTHGLYTIYLKPNLTSPWPIAFAYNKSQDPTTNVIRTQLLGVEYLDPTHDYQHVRIQDTQTTQAQTTANTITYPGAYQGSDLTYTYGNTGLKETILLSNTTKAFLQTHPPSRYGLSDTRSYLVFITRLDFTSLTPATTDGPLTGNTTITTHGIDCKDTLGNFKCALPLGTAYPTNQPDNTTSLTYRVIHLGNDWYLLSGLPVTTLSHMTFPVAIDPTITVYSSSNDGYCSFYNGNYTITWTSRAGNPNTTATSISIGQKKTQVAPGIYYIYRGFLYFDTSALTTNSIIDNASLGLYKVGDYSATDFSVTVQNGQPTYPHSPLSATDYNKTKYSGNGGRFKTVNFGTGYNTLYLNSSGRGWINKTGSTKLCLRSSRDISGTTPTGDEYITVTSNEFLGVGCQPKLTVIYRNQSKIKNTGSTTIKGYLLIQVQYHATNGTWVVDDDTINETTTRTITAGHQLGLDTIFNGRIRASDLSHGAGTYRIYAAFRDSEGNILVCNNGKNLVATWQFTVN